MITQKEKLLKSGSLNTQWPLQGQVVYDTEERKQKIFSFLKGGVKACLAFKKKKKKPYIIRTRYSEVCVCVCVVLHYCALPLLDSMKLRSVQEGTFESLPTGSIWEGLRLNEMYRIYIIYTTVFSYICACYCFLSYVPPLYFWPIWQYHQKHEM